MPVAVILTGQASSELATLFPELLNEQPTTFQCTEDEIEESAAGIVVPCRAAMTKTASGQGVRMPGRILIPWRLVSGCFHFETSEDIHLKDSMYRPIGFHAD